MFNYCQPKPLQDLQSETFRDDKRIYKLPEGTKRPSVKKVSGDQKKQNFQA